LGFRDGKRGTQTSRTLMLAELELLLAAVPRDASRERYAQAVLQENCLGKRTASTRKLTLQRLRELYGLDPGIPLFRIMRALWGGHETGRPILALLLALARDPLLRITAGPVLETRRGSEFVRQDMADALDAVAGGRFNQSTLDKIVRNASSAWTQSGHLRGRGRKFRQQAHPTPAGCAYALLIGYLLGRRGRRLIESPWARVLDVSPEEVMRLAGEAKRLGLLDMKQSGSVLDIGFSHLLTQHDKDLLHGAH